MEFINRYFWPLVGGSAVICAGSLALNLGGPAAVAGLVLGMLLMWKAGQRDPA